MALTSPVQACRLETGAGDDTITGMGPAQEWDAQHVSTPDQARAIIGEQFPIFARARIALLGSGWDNTAFLLDEAWVFRLPRRALGATLLATEVRVLPAIAAQVPRAVPLPRYIGTPTRAFPFPFAGYALIPGRTACHAGLSQEQRGALAVPLADFLRALHDMPASRARALGVPPDRLHRLDVTTRTPAALSGIDAMFARGEVQHGQAQALRALVTDAAGAAPPSASTLVHGDLYIRHVVLNDTAGLSGIIDWGDVHLGDPAMDLMLACMALPASARSRFWARYGAISEDTLRLARFRAVLHLGYLLAYAHDRGDRMLTSELRREVGYLLDT